MYAVIFMDRKGAATLGTFDDKGQCRRAWRTITTGAAVVDSAGSVLEYKTGTPDAVKRKLDAHAEWMKREGKLPPPGSAAPPEPTRAKLKVASVEIDVEEDDEDEEVPVAPPPAGPEDFRGEDYPAEGPQPLVSIACPPRYVGGKCESCGVPVPFPSDFCGPCDQRRAAPALDVTHAIAPATGAVVQGDDTERLAPPAAAVTCATKGCDHAPGIDRSNVRPAWRPFCGPCRVIIRQRGRSFPGGEAAVMEHLRAGTLPPVDATRAAHGAKGGGEARAPQKSRRPAPAPAPKPRRAASPATTLAAGLETARACAEVVSRLGGLAAARGLAALVEEYGGVDAVRETLAGVAALGKVAA